MGKCDITVPKVDNNSVLTMENKNLSIQETYGIWKRPCEQRNVNDLLLYKTLCGILHKEEAEKKARFVFPEWWDGLV